MISVIVTACSSFGLTISEPKTDIIRRQTQAGGEVSFTINAAGQVYKQTIEFVYSSGATPADRDPSIQATRRFQRAWACFQRYKGFITPCSVDASNGGNGRATTTPYRAPMRLPRHLPRA